MGKSLLCSLSTRPCRQWEIPSRAATVPGQTCRGEFPAATRQAVQDRGSSQPRSLNAKPGQAVQAMGSSQPRSHSAGVSVQRGIPGRDATGRAGHGKCPAAQPSGQAVQAHGKFPAARPWGQAVQAQGSSQPHSLLPSTAKNGIRGPQVPTPGDPHRPLPASPQP